MPKNARNAESFSIAAAPMPEKIIATPIFTELTIKRKTLKGTFESPAVIAINSEKPGIGLEIIKPMILKSFSDASASLNSFLPSILIAIGLPAKRPKKYAIVAPRLRPIQTTTEEIVQPKDIPAKVWVIPFGTGNITSAAKAIITIKDISNLLDPAQSIKVLP